MILAAVTPSIATPSVDWLAIAPELALGGAAVLIVLSRALLRRRARRHAGRVLARGRAASSPRA